MCSEISEHAPDNVDPGMGTKRYQYTPILHITSTPLHFDQAAVGATLVYTRPTTARPRTSANP